jgi:hypothetical protein
MKGLGNMVGLMKRHWEKALLALALIGLIGAVVYLNHMKSEENTKIEEYERGVLRPKVKPYPTVDVNMLSSAMRQATNASSLNFSPPHNLFNPVKWQKRTATGERIKAETGRELGINAVQIVQNTPLSTIITLDAPSGSGANMSVTMEANTTNYYRQRLRAFVSTNSTDRVHRASRAFTLRELRTAADGSAEADIELTDGTRVTVTATKPFNRIEAYKTDLLYPPENLSLKDRRAGDTLTVAGEDYIIVAITANEVVVSARSNDRRTTIRNNTGQ